MVKFFTILFLSLFLLPIFFFLQNTIPWIESPHIQMVRNEKTTEVLVNAEQSVGQNFVASSPNLAKIGLLIHRGQNPESRYIFHLKNTQENPLDLRKGIFEVRKIQEMAYFLFDPLPDSQGKSFYFYLEPLSETNEPLGLFTAANDLENGSMSLSHLPTNNDLIFQVYYKNERLNFLTFWKTLFERMSQYKPSFLKIPYLYIYWLLFALSFCFAIYFFIHSFFEESDASLSFRGKILFLFFIWGGTLAVFLWIQTRTPVFHLSS